MTSDLMSHFINSVLLFKKKPSLKVFHNFDPFKLYLNAKKSFKRIR